MQRIYTGIEVDDAIDIIFNHFDDLLLNGNFDQANKDIEDICVCKLNATLQVAVLCITLAAKSKLPARKVFFDTVKEIQTKLHSNVHKLLEGLE